VKFLCISCDQPMKLTAAAPPDRGSLAVTYACPTCGYRIALLTNPYETQVVQSLGVRIGPAEADPDATGGPAKCPFADVVQEMAAPAAGTDLPWTTRARERLQNIPEFVRPMARTGIEKFARDRGYGEVDEKVLDQAKDFFGM
jgi:hypothetical protein